MTKSVWRAKHYNIRLTPASGLLVTVRRFRTAKSNRSRRIKQLVIPWHFGSVREIAFKQQRFHRRRQAQRTAVQYFPFVPAIFVVLGLVGLVLFSTQVLKVQALEPPKTFPKPARVAKEVITASPASLPASEPTYISIASQSINAGIIPVGQAADGSIQTPPLFDWSTGWYNKSPTPGQVGPSIIVGHVDTYKDISVFWRLRYVAAGDRIIITRADGSTATFAVDSVEQFDQNNFPTQQVYGNIAYAGLRLITCGGSFDERTGSYTQNTVVFAHLVI